MKHIRLFETETEFESVKADIPKAWVTYTQDDSTVHYGSNKINNNGYEYVDLGLPSGLKWATCNVGATSPEEYGDYFMWGSTTPDTDNTCNWRNAPFNNGSSSFNETYFNEHKSEWLDIDVLNPEYDAAHIIMGGDWRMPTHEDFVELETYTNNEWVDDFEGSGVNGYLFTSKYNGSTLFIPASGYRYGTSMSDQGDSANLWSSSLYMARKNEARLLYFNSDRFNPDDYEDRYNGFCVRGVL